MHHLLERQLKKIAYKGGGLSPEQAEKFIFLVNQAYIDADDDRKLLENALDISSKEMQGLYEKLEASAKKELDLSEKKYKRLVENLKSYYFFYTYSTDRVLTYLSDSITDILGYSKEEFLADPTKYLSDDPINKKALRYSRKSIAGKIQPPYKISVYHKDGTLKYLEISEFPIFDDIGHVKEVEGIARDITEEISHSIQLQKVLDLQKNIVFLAEFIHDDNYFHMGKVPENMNWLEYIKTLEAKEKRIVSMLDKNGIPHAFTVDINEFNKNEYIISLTDISSTMTKQINLENKVLHDKLTQAYSREYFDLNYRVMIDKSRLNGEKLGLMMLDIDHFKKVNDTYGHNVGDEVLKKLVSVVKNSIRLNDTLVRWGGEEFIVLALVKSTDSLYATAEHIRKSVEKAYFNSVGHITISIGMTFYKENENIRDTIKRADDALYKAKKNGRNRVEKNWS